MKRSEYWLAPDLREEVGILISYTGADEGLSPDDVGGSGDDDDAPGIRVSEDEPPSIPSALGNAEWSLPSARKALAQAFMRRRRDGD